MRGKELRDKTREVILEKRMECYRGKCDVMAFLKEQRAFLVAGRDWREIRQVLVTSVADDAALDTCISSGLVVKASAT